MRRGVGNNFNLVGLGHSQMAERSALGGATLAQTFLMLVRRALSYPYGVNLAVPGTTSAVVLSTQLPVALLHHPGAACVMSFVNDMTTNISGVTWVGGGTSAATTKANLKSVVQQLQAQHCRVTLLTDVPVFETVYLDNAAPWVTAISQIPGETGCEFIDIYSNFLALDTATRNALLLDDEHPNVAGHAYIAGLRTGNQFTQI